MNQTNNSTSHPVSHPATPQKAGESAEKTRTLVAELKDKEAIHQLFLVKEKHLSLGKNGRPFLSLSLGDRSGSLDAKMWDHAETAAREFDVGDLVLAKGQIQLFQGRKQLIVHRIERDAEIAGSASVDMTEYIPTSNIDSQGLFLELLQIVKSMKNDHLRQLVVDSIEDPEIKQLLLKAPAAKSIHHAWIGGLLEHIVSMTKILVFMADHYRTLNRDLLIFGGIFHDLGKIWEISSEAGFSYTDRGRLIGHMELACELVDRKSQRILGFNPELRDICKHIILSHHGRLEFGSPKVPMFLEALLVAMVDDLDSKVSTVQTWNETERVSTEKWSRYSELFERYFLVSDLKAKFG
jgi:3'-5' exoribonuclease